MRGQATNIFNNRRRGEWNPLLLVMFALLTVAPSVLAAAPIHNAANQPQAVWQWLQSPEGAPTRDLLKQALDLENLSDLPPTQMAALLNTGLIRVQSGIDNPLSHLDSSHRLTTDTSTDESFGRLLGRLNFSTSCTLQFTFAPSLSSHEAAKLSGIRTNRRRN